MLYNNVNYTQIVSSFENAVESKSYIYQQDKDFVKYNFIKRDISNEIKGLGKGKYFDIITPFDYGGYQATCKDIFPDFFKEFSKYCREENIVSEFIRFCPMYSFDFDVISRYIDLTKVNDLIYIDLCEAFWSFYSRGRKSNINKIRNKNYVVKQVNIEEFYELYKETMLRNRAHEYFYFDIVALNKLVDEKFGRVFGIYLDNELISSIMILDEENTSYYFLGATSTNLLVSGANALLFHEVAMILQKEKQKVFFLGGGRKGVYDFKRRFSNKTLPYYIGKKIHNQEVYNYLVNLTNNHENDFFPKYREKVI